MENDAPSDGHILHGEAYPRDVETITLHLIYAESAGGIYAGRQFQIAKGDAETLARQILGIIAQPDTKTGWETIARDIHEGDHEA